MKATGKLNGTPGQGPDQPNEHGRRAYFPLRTCPLDVAGFGRLLETLILDYRDPDGTPAIQTRLYKPCGVVMFPTRGGRTIFISNMDDHQVRTLRWDVEPALY